MTIIMMLIPIALFLGLLALLAFVWTIRSGQYEDLDGDAYRILEEEDEGPLSPEDAKKRRALLEETQN